MPVPGYESLCMPTAERIVSKDSRNKQKHVAVNVDRNEVSHYQVDGVIVKDTRLRCDFLLMNEVKHTAYLIELKGSDLGHAAKQIDSTCDILKNHLAPYKVQARIVANKARTHAIECSEFRAFKVKWKNRFRMATTMMEENI